jgi:hypothetical protein
MRRCGVEDFWFSRSCTVPPDSFFNQLKRFATEAFSGAPLEVLYHRENHVFDRRSQAVLEVG